MHLLKSNKYMKTDFVASVFRNIKTVCLCEAFFVNSVITLVFNWQSYKIFCTKIMLR